MTEVPEVELSYCRLQAAAERWRPGSPVENARWMGRSHCNENVARAYVFGGGHDGREAVLIGRDCACEEPRRTGTRFRRPESRRHSPPELGLPAPTCRKRDWYSHHWICSGRAVGHSHDQRLERLSGQHKLRRSTHAQGHCAGDVEKGQKSGRVRCWERHRRLHAHSRLDWRDLP